MVEIPSLDMDPMNDPSLDQLNARDSKDGHSEPYHCRICRSEGTAEEPLFYPCKCSGSIKFVHQECLTEWLKHSQRRYCELCNTPFRFTQLYDPNMPNTIPPLVFVGRLAVHVFKTFILWLRFTLVCTVWLGWLPWCVRWMWRFYFWLGDADWAVPTKLPDSGLSNSTNISTLEDAQKSIFGNSSAEISAALAGQSEFTLFPKISNITTSPLVNKVIFDVVEGQALAIAIFSCFFIIFLVREWVIQQQPDIGGFNGDAVWPEEVAAPLAAQAQARRGINEPQLRQLEENIARLQGAAALAAQVQAQPPPPPPARDVDQAAARVRDLREDDLAAERRFLRARQRTRRSTSDLRDPDAAEGSQDAFGSHSTPDIRAGFGGPSETARNNGTNDFTFNRFNTIPDSAWTSGRQLGSDGQFQFGAGPRNEATENTGIFRFDAGGAVRFQGDNGLFAEPPAAPLPPITAGASTNVAANQSDSDWLQDIEKRLNAPSRAQASSSRERGEQDTSEANEESDNATRFLFGNVTAEDLAEFGERRGPGHLADDGASSTDTEDSLGDSESPGNERFRAIDPNVLDSHQFANHRDDNGAGIMSDNEELEHDDDEVGIQQPQPAGNPFAPAAPAVDDANEDGLLPEDEGDDIDGVLELMGIRGPLIVLFQNAAISVVLLNVAVCIGVAVPYCWGRVVLLILAHPVVFFLILPLTLASYFGELVVDAGTWALTESLFVVDLLVRTILKMWSGLIPEIKKLAASTTISAYLRKHADVSKDRILSKLGSRLVLGHKTAPLFRNVRPGHLPYFSAVSRVVWTKATDVFNWAADKLSSGIKAPIIDSNNTAISSSSIQHAAEKLRAVADWASSSAGRNVTAPLVPDMDPYAPSYSWTARERVLAVIAGYAFFTVVGAMYLANSRMSRNNYRRAFEKSLQAVLQQAGGVMKVILIIGVEMVVFPLFCGVLLDIALLPLFEDATIISRAGFTVNHLFTSIFLHWFVGTCYMFHFALFVSMCRKIMRPGVLYFIRDPDDPTFHPVKDVLDRPVLTQLRKIGYSALIYGFLVLICLGGVVWGLHYSTDVLPIHWSSNEPVLEFPVDLLLYNFFMPLAVEHFKPADTLQTAYGWWFRKCARILRLTSFLFGIRVTDEEGHHPNPIKAASHRIGTVMTASPEAETETDPIKLKEKEKKRVPPEVLGLTRSGKYVRAPAADSVRRTRGQTVFIEVDEQNNRNDGLPEPASPQDETGKESATFKMVYIPPAFRFRLGLMILMVWLFAAMTGVAVTIGPLVVGRYVLSMLVPKGLKTNDVYAFSIGLYIVGGFAFLNSKRGVAAEFIKKYQSGEPLEPLDRPAAVFIKSLKIAYLFFAFGLVIPTLFALLMEFYIIIPLHTYFSLGNDHVVHFIQDWTLGVLYVKLMGRLMLMDGESHWARDLRAIVARGYTNPDIKIATRKFILPASGAMFAALVIPMGWGAVVVKLFYDAETPQAVITPIYRYSYPAVFLLVLLGFALRYTKRFVDRWQQNIRDEVYSIGQQLHNHVEGSGSSTAVATVGGVAR